MVLAKMNPSDQRVGDVAACLDIEEATITLTTAPIIAVTTVVVVEESASSLFLSAAQRLASTS